MPKNRVLDSRHVLRLDPVLGRTSEKTLGRVLLFLHKRVVAKRGVNGRQSHDHIGIISSDPGLPVHASDVKGFNGVVWNVLVVLFENLVEAHEIDIDVFFEAQKFFGDHVCFRSELFTGSFIARVDCLFNSLEFGPKSRDFFESKLFYFDHLIIHRLEEDLLRDSSRIVLNVHTMRVRGRGHSERYLTMLQIDALGKTLVEPVSLHQRGQSNKITLPRRGLFGKLSNDTIETIILQVRIGAILGGHVFK